MATISLCMIVKNEENVLHRCLDSIHDLVDEIVIVDTGSTDATKRIAAEYTDRIYDFEWIQDFSVARNFSFSKCTMDYIYVADADEYLDESNRFQFKILKENIFPEIEIVQMMYETISHDTVLNIKREYRPKLFKRLREFVWINPVHETVRLDPIVFDSDIVVTHDPESNHAKRDFSIFEKTIGESGVLSDNLIHMYATELYKNGTYDDFKKAFDYFKSLNNEYGFIITTKWLRLSGDESLVSYAKNNESISEIYFELGEYYYDRDEYILALDSYKKAINGEAYVDIHKSGDHTLEKIVQCLKKLSEKERIYESELLHYTALLSEWRMPEEEML